MYPGHPRIVAKYHLSQARFWSAFLRLQALRLKANFDPNQPRVPRGYPDGGQWTDDPSFGGGGEYRGRRTRLAQGSVGSPYAIESLLDHEGRYGGHTIAMHVGKSEAFLIRRLMTPVLSWGPFKQYLTATSTFRNVKEATGFINEALSHPSNRAKVTAVIEGRSAGEEIESGFDKNVGFGYVSDAPAGSVGARPGRPRRVEMSAVSSCTIPACPLVSAYTRLFRL